VFLQILSTKTGSGGCVHVIENNRYFDNGLLEKFRNQRHNFDSIEAHKLRILKQDYNANTGAASPDEVD
jgi:hypothetical protein